MGSIIGIEKFAADFYQEILLAKESDVFNLELENFFTAIMLEYLEEIGEIEDYVICPYRDSGLQMDGYHVSENNEAIDIYVSNFSNSESLVEIGQSEIDSSLKRAIQLYRKARNDLIESLKKDTDTFGFATTIFKIQKTIKKVRIIAITNAFVKPINLKNIMIDGVEISFLIWDIDRLYKCSKFGEMREIIEIDFTEKFHVAIDCIKNESSSKYCVYLAIIPGRILAQLYEEFGDKLLEKNVRSFLQVKGQVNKGIRETLKNEPDMFLAFNNGISVTAENVQIIEDENGKPSITKITGMQIVNGGQTTASIFHAMKELQNDLDLNKVYVPMKLSVISDINDMDFIVPKISAFANTQNKVQIADFSANDPFHRAVEELSRAKSMPEGQSQKNKIWFYERARGQYSDLVNSIKLPLDRKKFREQHVMFGKTDLAKFENTWDQLPHYVSMGAQKNFTRFTIRLSERPNFIPDTKYYENLISKLILFKETEKIIQTQNYGGYKANIVAYTLAFLSNKSSQRISLEKIWEDQQLSPALEKEISNISHIVHSHITNPPGGANVGEWCKNIKCWNSLKEIEYSCGKDLESELISVAKTENSKPKNSINSTTDDEIAIIEEVKKVPAQTWFSLSKWAKETNNFLSWQRSLIFTIGIILSRNNTPSYKQANQALIVYKEAVDKGFI